MKIASIAGAHLDFILAMPISQRLRRHHTEVLIYPGRHNDFHVSRIYAEHLALTAPDLNLDVNLSDCETAAPLLLSRVEKALLEHQPDLVIVRGETTLTLVTALAANRLRFPLARIDGGRRAYTKQAPEELARLVADRLADIVFCSSVAARQRLAAEGIVDGVHISGDILGDVVRQYLPAAEKRSSILSRVGLYPGYYVLAILNRLDTLNNPVRLRGIVSALNAIREPIVLPSQPAARLAIEKLGLTLSPHILSIEPLAYLDQLMLASRARAIVTDDDQIQREAYFLSIPCITVRETTESPETVDTGWNRVVGTQPDQIIATVRDFAPPLDHVPVLGDGCAADRIVEVLERERIEYSQNYGRVPISLMSLPLAL